MSITTHSDNVVKSSFFSIKFKVTSLILLLSVTSLIGIGVLAHNGSSMQQVSHDLTSNYENSLANNYFSKFDDFLNAIQASSGISQDFAEVFYMMRNKLSREELAKAMEDEYHAAFARETALLGGGAFYEPNAFYPEVHDFHYFVSKELTASGIPAEKDVHWVGDEWKWDVDTFEESWYQVALPKGWNRATPRDARYYWSELYVDTSVDALMVTVSIPIYSTAKRIVGVSTVDVSLATLQKMVLSFPLPTPSTQIAGFSVVNNATFAVSGSDKFDIVEYPEGSWLNNLKDLKPGEKVNKTISIDGKDYTYTASVHNSGIGLALLISNEEKYAAVDALQSGNFITVIVIVAVMVLIIILVIYALSIWIVKPIHKTFGVLETFARGDLTQKVSADGSDELSQMMRMIGSTQDNFKRIITAIGEKASALHDDSQSLSFVAGQLASSANGTVEKSDNIANTTDKMVKNIDAMANGAEEASVNANDVASTAEQMSVNMSTIAAAIEEMSASISQIAGNTVEVREIATAATTKATDATTAMNTLGAAAKEIGQVTDVIKKIADKTNLLALNATIEAASAGEAGKGFAVVANEIKELANQSAESADDIANRIEHIQKGTNAAVNVIKDVSDIITKINTSVESIAGHVNQQTKASNEIANNVAQANTGAKRVAGAISEVAKSTSEVSQNAGDAARGVSGVNSNVVDMNMVAKESAQGATQVNRSAGGLSEIAEELKQTVAQFKV